MLALKDDWFPRLGPFADGKLELIKHRENAVYRLEAGNENFAVRVHRLNYHTGEELASEHVWAQALAKVGIVSPLAVPTPSDETYLEIQPDGRRETFLVDVLTWAMGTRLGSIEGGAEVASEDMQATFRRVGALQAKTHNFATSWDRPAGFVRHSWGLDGLVGQNPFWGRFWELEALDDDRRARYPRA